MEWIKPCASYINVDRQNKHSAHTQVIHQLPQAEGNHMLVLASKGLYEMLKRKLEIQTSLFYVLHLKRKWNRKYLAWRIAPADRVTPNWNVTTLCLRTHYNLKQLVKIFSFSGTYCQMFQMFRIEKNCLQSSFFVNSSQSAVRNTSCNLHENLLLRWTA